MFHLHTFAAPNEVSCKYTCPPGGQLVVLTAVYIHTACPKHNNTQVGVQLVSCITKWQQESTHAGKQRECRQPAPPPRQPTRSVPHRRTGSQLSPAQGACQACPRQGQTAHGPCLGGAGASGCSVQGGLAEAAPRTAEKRCRRRHRGSVREGASGCSRRAL
mgnify:CR=1 FL=1